MHLAGSDNAMKLPAPFIELPIRFDAGAMAAEIAALDDAGWQPHPQALPGNSMLPLIAVNGDPADESFAGRMLPTPPLKRCPYVMQVLASLGATLGRTRLMRLAGQAEVSRHVDQGYYWAERVRVHVPVVTQPTVRFECGDAAINMAAGECWIFDTWRQHRVLNDSHEARIHLVVDTVGGGPFWELVARGRPVPHGPGQVWQPGLVRPEAGRIPVLTTEAVNVPSVMSPWELNAHFRLLFSDAVQHSQLSTVRVIAQRFMRNWQGLWARFGESEEGRQHYQQALQRFIDEVHEPSREIQLDNGLPWFSAMGTLIAKAAVSMGPRKTMTQDAYGTSDRA